jgi:hypothetical protein
MNNYPFDSVPCFTGQAPTDRREEYTQTAKSNWELVEQYYIEPLSKMGGHEAFICLINCFALYEKYLRKTQDIPLEETFSEGHRVFHTIGKELGISETVAYLFWSHWRNGLLHHAMPKSSQSYTTWLTSVRQPSPITIDGNHISINPWSFRDFVLEKLASSKKIWKEEDFPLLTEIRKL